MFHIEQKEKSKMNKKVEKSVCPICDKKFVKKVSNQVYCSPKCKAIAKAAAKRKARKAAKSVPAQVKNGDKFKANAKKFACVKGGKKPVAKKIEEKVKLPKPPAKKPDVIVLVHGNDPYKKFAIALQIAIREFRNIVAATQLVTKNVK